MKLIFLLSNLLVVFSIISCGESEEEKVAITANLRVTESEFISGSYNSDIQPEMTFYQIIGGRGTSLDCTWALGGMNDLSVNGWDLSLQVPSICSASVLHINELEILDGEIQFTLLVGERSLINKKEAGRTHYGFSGNSDRGYVLSVQKLPPEDLSGPVPK